MSEFAYPKWEDTGFPKELITFIESLHRRQNLLIPIYSYLFGVNKSRKSNICNNCGEFSSDNLEHTECRNCHSKKIRVSRRFHVNLINTSKEKSIEALKNCVMNYDRQKNTSIYEELDLYWGVKDGIYMAKWNISNTLCKHKNLNDAILLATITCPLVWLSKLQDLDNPYFQISSLLMDYNK